MKRAWMLFIIYSLFVVFVGFELGYWFQAKKGQEEFYRGMYFICIKADVDRHTCRQEIGKLVPYNPYEWPMSDWVWPIKIQEPKQDS